MALSEERRERAVLGVAFFAILLAAWPTLINLPGTWANNGHGYFVAALTAWLIWRDRDVLFRTSGPGIGDLIPVLAFLSVGWMFAVAMNLTSVHEGLLTVVVVGWAFATFGWQARRTILAIGLTFWLAVPLWGGLTPVLQRATVIMSGGATRLAGISAEIGYDYISLTTGTFLVEAGCAGMNYLMGALVLGAFYAHFFVARWQTQLKIVAIVAAVSIVGNWIRVSVLIFIGEATAMQSSLLGDHLWQGWLIFTLLMIPTHFVIRRIEVRDAGKPGGAASPAVTTAGVDPLRARRAIVAALAGVVGPVLFMGFGAIPRSDDLDRDLADVQFSDAWDAAVRAQADPSGWTPAFRGIDESLTWTLETDGGERVELTRHYFVDQRQDEELVQWANAIAPGPELLSERFVGPVGTARRIVREAIVRSEDGPRVVWYWYRVARRDTPFPSKAKLLEIVAFFQRTSASELITLSAACAAEDCTGAAALRAVAGPEGGALP